jgi:metal-responsive CopG/Arc/MetJ family transcriptional regulator
MEGDLLESLDALAEQRHTPRAVLIREACRRYVTDERERELDAVYEDGYRRVPEDSSIGQAQAAMAAQVLPEESW